MRHFYSEDFHEVAAARSNGVETTQQKDVDDDAEAEQYQQAILSATAGEDLDQTNVGESWVDQALKDLPQQSESTAASSTGPSAGPSASQDATKKDKAVKTEQQVAWAELSKKLSTITRLAVKVRDASVVLKRKKHMEQVAEAAVKHSCTLFEFGLVHKDEIGAKMHIDVIKKTDRLAAEVIDGAAEFLKLARTV